MLGCPVQGDVRQREAHQLRDAQPACETKVQHGAVPDAEPRCRVWGIEDQPHLIGREMPRQRLVMTLCWDGVDLHDLLQGGRHAELDIPHEGLDRGEPGIAGRSTVATLLLDVGQEVEHEGGVDVLEAELGRSLSHTFAGKDEQQPKGVRVGFAGVGAVAPLGRHVFAQEGGDQRGDRHHAASLPAISASAVAAMSAISSGVASRYQ